MSSPVRVMIVDDSSVVRRLLTSALAQHPEVEVVGSASNGLIALHKLDQIKPELVILDVEMPEMDGLTALAHLRQNHPRLPVIMFSTLTERGANVTFDALAAGASDYVLKPSTQSGETLDHIVSNSLVPKIVGLTRSRFGLATQAAMVAAQDVSTERGGKPSAASQLFKSTPTGNNPLLAKPAPALAVKPQLRPQQMPGLPQRPQGPSAADALFGATTRESPALPATPVPARPAPAPAPASPAIAGAPVVKPALGAAAPAPLAKPVIVGARKPVQIIAIAASTGGPNALAEVLPRLPVGLPVPIVIVQHMPPIFTRCLADRLSSRSALKVIECVGRERLMPGQIYLAPGNRHLELERDAEGVHTLLTDAPPEHSCRPAADVLFRSVVRIYGGATLGVVLTGMGQDGLRGAREIYEAGGRVLVQSGPTCVIWGMPKAVEEAGLAEAVVPLSDMAAAILTRVGAGILPQRSPEGGR